MTWFALLLFAWGLLAWLANPRGELTDWLAIILGTVVMAPVVFLIWLAGELLPPPWGRGPRRPRRR